MCRQTPSVVTFLAVIQVACSLLDSLPAQAPPVVVTAPSDVTRPSLATGVGGWRVGNAAMPSAASDPLYVDVQDGEMRFVRPDGLGGTRLVCRHELPAPAAEWSLTLRLRSNRDWSTLVGGRVLLRAQSGPFLPDPGDEIGIAFLGGSIAIVNGTSVTPIGIALLPSIEYVIELRSDAFTSELRVWRAGQSPPTLPHVISSSLGDARRVHFEGPEQGTFDLSIGRVLVEDTVLGIAVLDDSFVTAPLPTFIPPTSNLTIGFAVIVASAAGGTAFAIPGVPMTFDLSPPCPNPDADLDGCGPRYMAAKKLFPGTVPSNLVVDGQITFIDDASALPNAIGPLPANNDLVTFTPPLEASGSVLVWQALRHDGTGSLMASRPVALHVR